MVSNKYDGITFNFDFEKFILAWIVQIIQSFPFGMLNFNGGLYSSSLFPYRFYKFYNKIN